MRLPAMFDRKPGRAPKVRQAVLRTIPAPVGGWNARDPLAKMKPTEAVDLVNLFPRLADVVVRSGDTDWLTGMAGQVESLLPYTSGSLSKLFAADNTGIYDATATGVAGVALTPLTNGRLQYVQMGVSAGHYLICANGVDNMKYYDGAAWITVTAVSAPAITGVATTAIISATVYQRRLFLIESGKLNFWYLPADAVGGVATEFLLGPVTTRGGYTVAAMSWSFDGGDGLDDYIAFATSEGEVVIYKGINPSSAADWVRVGTFLVGKPLGRRCFQKYGGDCILLTQNGAFPLSLALQSSTIDYKLTLSNKIEGAFNLAAVTYFSNFGWDMTLYPTVGAFIVNVPITSGSRSEQYVMNTVTKSWCKFTGWNANCFVEFGRELYYGASGKVVKAWTGRSDRGNNINAYAKVAYNYFGTMEHKQWGHIRPQLLVDGPLTYSLGLSVDFRQETALAPASYTSFSAAQWDVALWDQGLWAGSLELIPDWRTTAQVPGACAALLMAISTNTLEIQWAASDYWYTPLDTPLT